MPFDGFSFPPKSHHDLFQQRRESAAALWKTIDPKNFDLRYWRSDKSCCALGWLAQTGHEGWSWRAVYVVGEGIGMGPMGPDGRLGFDAAQSYFGLTSEHALLCFGSTRWTALLHYRWTLTNVTGSRVAKTLLTLPIKVPVL